MTVPRFSASLLVGAYVVGVVAAATVLLGERPATLAGPIVIAVSLRPVSRAARRITGTDRTPADALLAVASSLGRVREPAAVLDSTVEAIRAATGARSVEVRRGDASGRVPQGRVAVELGAVGTVLFEPGQRPLPARDVLDGLAAQLSPILENIAARAELAGRLRLLEEQAAVLAENRRRVIELGDWERESLERDLHDGAQQCLMALVLRLGLKNAAEDPEIVTLLRRARATLEDASEGWVAGTLGAADLADALRQHVGQVGAAEIHVSSSVTGELPVPLARAAFFVCVEAVQNALRHGNASRIDIALDDDGGSLHATVSDDGCGFDTTRSEAGGTGLSGARHRAAAFGGRVHVRSQPGRGTVVTVVLPVTSGAAA